MSDSSVIFLLLELILGILAFGFALSVAAFGILLAQIFYRDWNNL